ncbi:hypothetical protein Hdeb2414_s0010g00336211 [Helianthus debilis subsp. tardiflorus]
MFNLITQSWNHDVFLSFIGEATLKTTIACYLLIVRFFSIAHLQDAGSVGCAGFCSRVMGHGSVVNGSS